LTHFPRDPECASTTFTDALFPPPNSAPNPANLAEYWLTLRVECSASTSRFSTVVSKTFILSHQMMNHVLCSMVPAQHDNRFEVAIERNEAANRRRGPVA
jgi:hypothetical protein